METFKLKSIILPAAFLLLAFVVAGSFTASAIERTEVLRRAAEFADHEWECSEENTKASCADNYECDYTPGTYIGLPYDWGGYKTVQQFDEDLENGLAAGSHSKDGVLACTTGLDCSGFVSQCWGAGHNSTSSMHTITDEIDLADIEPGDAFNKAGSHIVLFAYYRPDGVPAYYEAAGGVHKTWLNTTASWASLNGYVTLKYEDIEGEGPADDDDDGPAGTIDDPIIIEKFPFIDDRDTRRAKSREFDEYNCKPGTYEWGGEYIYYFELDDAGVLTASVNCGSGADIDLHVLTALDEDACLERDDKNIEMFLEAGEYYLVADTWTKSDGTEYPGAYHLEVYFDIDSDDDDDNNDNNDNDDDDNDNNDDNDDTKPDAGDTDDDDNNDDDNDNNDDNDEEPTFVDELFESEDCECNVSRTGGGASGLIFLLLAMAAALFAKKRIYGKR